MGKFIKVPIGKSGQPMPVEVLENNSMVHFKDLENNRYYAYSAGAYGFCDYYLIHKAGKAAIFTPFWGRKNGIDFSERSNGDIIYMALSQDGIKNMTIEEVLLHIIDISQEYPGADDITFKSCVTNKLPYEVTYDFIEENAD